MYKFFVFILSLFAFSCAISKNDNTKIDLNKFDLYYIKNGDVFNFYFIFNPVYTNLKDTINFDKINLLFFTKNQKEKIEIKLECVFSSFYKNSENSYQQTKVYHGKITSIDLNGINPDDITVETMAYFKNKKFLRKNQLSTLELQPNYSKLEFLKLYPKLTVITDDILRFDLFAIRVVPHSGEYLPSSEILKIELYNYNSGRKLVSSEGKNFLQVITDVEPKIVGDYKVFSTEINLSKQVFLERNLIKYIIPAIPNNYVIELNFWKDK